MKDKYKTKKQLINELLEMRQRIAELEKSENQRKQLEEALKDSEAQYKALFDRTLYCVYIHDFEGRFMDANEAALNLLGYTREEIPSLNFSSLIGEDQLPKAFKDVEEILQPGTPKRANEYKLRKKDGGYVWVETEASLIYRKGKPYAIQGIARDITKRKRVQESLQVQIDKFEGIITSLTDGLDIINRDYRIEFQNKMLRDRFGNMAGKFCYEVYMGRETPCEVCPMVKAIATGSTQELETTSIDGRIYEVTSIPFQDIDGETKAIEIVRDITEHKQAEKALVESEERYRRMVSAITAYTYSVEFKEGQAVFTHHSIGCLPVTGYKPEDYESEPYLWYTMIYPEDQILVGKSLNEIMAGREVSPIEHRLIRRDGSTVWVRNTMVPYIDEKGRLIRYDGLIEDITERKRAEEALRESESKFRILAQTNAAAIFIIQGNNFQYVNPALETITGYSEEELLTMNFWDFVHPEFQELVKERGIARQRGEKVPSRYEFKIITKSGETRWLDTTAGIIEYKGKPATIAASIETTVHKQAVEALLESEEKFRAISNTAVDAILMMDNTGRISYWNPAAERMFGYASAEAMGKELHLFLAPERYHKAYKEGFKRFRETGQGPAIGNTSEFYAIRKDGTEFPIEVSTSAIQIKGMWHSVGIIRNITERKRVEEALLESEQNYRALFEESKDIIYMSTPDGKFLDINPAGIELFGYPSKEEILQINIANDLYANPDDREKFQQVLARDGYVKDYEVVIKRRDGEHIIVLLTSTAVQDEKGEIIAYRGIMKDITERKRLEQQLLQAQKMEAVGQLAGGVAHDFNNILTAIIGFGTLLKIETGKDELLRSYVTQILTSAERAATLTQALLAFSRRQIISPTPLNLNEIIQRVERLLSRLIGEDIELSTFLTDKDLTVMADSGQIETVLMNLATNARDAMPDGGSLIIKTERIELDHEFIKAHGYGKPGFYALISVEDTGLGMDDKTKERIFEPFFTTKEVGKGTGLGLAMVYGIIKQHNGYINVYSEPRKGSIFKIYLPLIKSKVEEAEPVAHPVLKGGTETVIVAEDDAQVRELIKEVLEGLGYKVMEAEDGEDALKVFNENKDRIQLLILDVVMPKKNGKEVYNEIGKVRPDIKAIFISGYNADIIHQKGILEEGLDFISKPILPDELLRKVREVLDR
jgi:two-component system cell cycle sensor histidine kinase/response regulator CckA